MKKTTTFYLLGLILLFTQLIYAQAVHDSLFKSVKWRNIGPHRGGRSVATSGVSNHTMTYYMGTTGGGLWKTEDMGISWSNISDGYFKTGSVGAVAVAESDNNVVYVGMGEHAVRGVMTHHGDGVYKSTDAGKTWKKMGLDLSQHISRIVIHPTNPDVVYVAVQGALYSKSEQRGLFKSTDGGQTWNKILYVDDKTGCAELSMDATNPRILYAAMWEHGRLPWKVISGGPGSGLYKSVDAGATWEKLSEGLPKEMGKMSIAACRSNPEKVYALIEGDSPKENGGLFVSDNAGKSWSHVTNDHRLVQRAWYYIELFTDPQNDQIVYVLSATAYKSIDGGKTWEALSGTHGDYHDLWINPKNPANMAIADDGGVAITFNGGKSWSQQENIPTAQFYRINTDNLFPYNIYGGQQDNTSVKIASRELGSSSISTESWTYSAGGESAFLAFDPNQPDKVLGGSYQGTIEVLDTKAKGGTNIMASPIQYLSMDAKDMKYRFNWNAPIIWSQHEPHTFYHGAQLLLKTSDWGKTWKEVSPDLTRNEKDKQGKGGGPYTNEAVGAENYGTLSYVMESPHEKGVIWTGSDDGMVYLTRDNGKTWNNVTPAGLKECLVNAIEVSPHNKGTAYIATTRYKFNDHTPGLYKTDDYGKSWTAINTGLPGNAFTRVVREDKVRKDLLYAGTELGFYLSFDGGKNWQALQLNLPITPITDLRQHGDDLIAATSGRSFWILDDLSLFRQWNGMPKQLNMITPEDSYLANGGSALNKTDEEFKGMGSTTGINPANGTVIYYTLPEIVEKQEVKLLIKDASGRLIRSFSSVKDSTYKKWDGGPPEDPTLSAKKGINRFVWNHRHPTLPGIPDCYFENSFSGHKVVPGSYTLELTYNGKSVTTQARVLANPLYGASQADYLQYDAVMTEMENNVKDMHNRVNTLHKQQLQLDELLKQLAADATLADLVKEGQELSADMKKFDLDMVQRLSKAYDDVENFPNKFSSNYMYMMNMTESDIPQVNQGTIELKKINDALWEVLKKRSQELMEVRIPAYNQKLFAKGIGGIWMK